MPAPPPESEPAIESTQGTRVDMSRGYSWHYREPAARAAAHVAGELQRGQPREPLLRGESGARQRGGSVVSVRDRRQQALLVRLQRGSLLRYRLPDARAEQVIEHLLRAGDELGAAREQPVRSSGMRRGDQSRDRSHRPPDRLRVRSCEEGPRAP